MFVPEWIFWGIAILVSLLLLPALVRAIVAAVWGLSAVVALSLMVAIPAGLLALIGWGLWAAGRAVGFWGG